MLMLIHEITLVENVDKISVWHWLWHSAMIKAGGELNKSEEIQVWALFLVVYEYPACDWNEI